MTVLLAKPRDVAPQSKTEFPVLRREPLCAPVAISGPSNSPSMIAQPSPSSRDVLRFEAARNGATSRCDLILDLSGGAPLFPAHELRPGYLRADPAMRRRLRKLFDTASRTRRHVRQASLHRLHTGALCIIPAPPNGLQCAELDLCPTGAITPNGDHVSIDPNICAGCGACASACPTGAAAYALPPADRLRCGGCAPWCGPIGRLAVSIR